MSWRAFLLGVCGIGLGVGTAAAAEVPAGWLQQVQQAIAGEEYRIEGEGGVCQAPNRAHGFRSVWTSAGIKVTPREEGTPSWEWSLALRGIGRAGRLEVGRAAVAPRPGTAAPSTTAATCARAGRPDLTCP